MWILAIGLNWAVLYGLYPWNVDNGGVIDPQWLHDLYACTFRTVWAMTCAWVAYACLTGWGGRHCRLSLRRRYFSRMWTARLSTVRTTYWTGLKMSERSLYSEVQVGWLWVWACQGVGWNSVWGPPCEQNDRHTRLKTWTSCNFIDGQ